MVRVKICGITNKKDAVKAVALGADALGFVFYKKSPRYISPGKAKRIIQELPPFVSTVGVFVNEKAGVIRDVIKYSGVNTIQLHGDEDYHFVHRLKRYNVKIIKAFRVGESFHLEAVKKYKVDGYLFDTYSADEYGGTGEVFDWKILKNLQTLNVPLIISGGLDPRNVVQLLNEVKPFAVDVSSGVEGKPGEKDHKEMKSFIENVGYVSGLKVVEE